MPQLDKAPVRRGRQKAKNNPFYKDNISLSLAADV
jgi:hypothetical protein